MTVSCTRRPQRGFTLLELVVAAGILALIAVFSWRGLDALVREREAIAASQATIDVVQRSFARIERDALLATDVQLDDKSLRFVAGPSSIDGVLAQNVDYRLAAGALTRVVPDVDRAPLTMIDGIATLEMEAWAPTPQGAKWLRTKDAVLVAPTPVATPGNGGPATFSPPPATGETAVARAPGAAATAAAQPSPNAATGVRFTIALADGSRIVRSFIVGGG